MESVARSADLIIYTAGLMLCTISLIQAATNKQIEKATKRFFVLFFSVIELYMICLLVRWMERGYSGAGWAALSRAIFFTQAILPSLLTVFVTALILHQSGEERWCSNKGTRISLCFWGIYTAMQVINLFNGFLYFVDEGNVYHRGPYFALQMLPPLLIMAVNFVILRRRRDRISQRQRIAFLIYIVVPVVCMIIQAQLFGINLIGLGTIIAAMFMFGTLVADEREKYQRQEAENAHLKIDALMVQIRPHFLFNTLTTIKYLIGSQPEKADEAITAFMKYLRHNTDSLLTDRMTQFCDELEQVKSYMEIQMLRFGDELSVEYDLECTDFRMPALTLLPLVENAVNYGVRRSKDRSGVVKIQSRRYPDRIELSVIDNGPGFVPDVLPDDRERSHIGIRNVRERIERVSQGQLILDSEIGRGTTVTIVLPQ